MRDPDPRILIWQDKTIMDGRAADIVHVEIGSNSRLGHHEGQHFLLTPEEYAESVAEWAEALNLAGKRRA